jgi:hypothetical protein
MRRILVLALTALVFLTTSHVHARTEGGDLLWQADFDLAGAADRAAAVAAAHGRVVAVSNSTDPVGNVTSVVRALTPNGYRLTIACPCGTTL